MGGLLNRLFYKRRKYFDDDFDWDNYTTDSYKRRLEGVVEQDFATIAKSGELSFDAQTGLVKSTGRPIHPNQQLIYEAIGQLQPGSVHEVGCGGGDHLANGQALFPDIRFTGGDRSQGQLDLAGSRHPELDGRLELQDITMPFSRHWPRTDLVYSQTVLMHIHTAVSHFVGIANMVNMAERQVLMMENWNCHNFVADILGLAEGGHFTWSDLHLYRFDGSTGAVGLLLSPKPLDLPNVTGDADLRAGLKPSERRLRRAAEGSERAIFGRRWR